MKNQRNAPARLLALSDGLFATVLTLLVLDLRIPDALGANGDLAGVARSIGPHFLSYLLTFLVAANYWLTHHRDYDRIVAYDRTLLGYNLLFLLFVGLFPFTTALLSSNIVTLRTFPTYWGIYTGNLAAAGIMLFLTWSYAARHRLLDDETTPAEIRNINALSIANPVVFLASLIAQLLIPQSLIGPYVLLAFPVLAWWINRSAPREGPAAPPVRLDWSDRLWQAGPGLVWMFVLGLAVWLISR